MVNCKICQQDFENNHKLFLHFSRKHNLSSKEYYDKFFKKETDGKCLICNKDTNFKNLSVGYFKYCSTVCSSKSTETIAKRKQTNLKIYGNENYVNAEQNSRTWKMKTKDEIEIIRNKQIETLIKKYNDKNYRNFEKIKQTKKEKYGDENFTNRKKYLETCKEKLNVNNVFQLESVKEKIKQTKKEKYGDEKFTNKEKFKRTQFLNRIKRIEEYIKNRNLKIKIVDVSNLNFYKFECENCKKVFEINSQMFLLRMRNNQIICNNLECNPYANYYCGSSKYEKELINFLKLNVPDHIVETNVKNIISPYELDIYISDLKLAIEFNGLYWHSELFKDLKYHLTKTELCEKQGIHLIHIYEDDWVYKQDIIKSRILNLLGKSTKIYARDCEIRNVIFKESKNFLEKNHIQGYNIGKHNIGLYCNNDLVSLMTFGSLRRNLGQVSKEGYFELLRFCNKLNHTVIGGANKLFSYFVDKYKPVYIVSYADRSWTMNNGKTLYDKLGFSLTGITKPDYYYVINNNIKENRFKYRKDILVGEGYDTNKSEHEIMFERGYYRIYDSGNLKFIWIKN